MTEYTLEEILSLDEYTLSEEEKNEALLGIMKSQLASAYNNNIHIKNFIDKQNIEIHNIATLNDIPPLPVQMFKYFNLATCPEKDIVRVLKSSGTTSGSPSNVPLSKITTINQVKALNSILSNYLGKKRKVFLVIDHEGINDPASELSARTAGVRGLSSFSKKIFYLLKEVDGKLELNTSAIEEVTKKYEGYEVYIFGFTFIIWSIFYKKIVNTDFNFNFKNVKIFHSGGWKKLRDQQVSKEYFSEQIANIFNTAKESVIDFYGMAEQTGIIFVDCEQGNKHVPNFSQVIIRDIQSLKPASIGETGLIEVMSILSDSYYCQAVLTEDIGYILGIDDCPCGRKGRYFRFKSRMEKVEIRGCGDTFKEDS